MQIFCSIYSALLLRRVENLRILESLRFQVWIPRQFWEEYKGKLPTIRKDIKDEYIQNRNAFQNLHHEKIINLEQFSTRTRYALNPEIFFLLDQANTLLSEEVSTFRSDHSTWLREGDIENRIEELFAGSVGDPLPDSNMADIPSMWQWRLERGIPPGLKDRKKREPNRYGDLMGWLQIKRHANGRDRPVIMVTDDEKPNDWFVLKNGNPSGPHPDLTRELYNEAGVELYLYTSKQFMWIAQTYLKWQRLVAASGDYIHRLTPTLLPDFGKIAAIGRMPVLTATASILGDYGSSRSAMAGLTVGVSSKGLLNSISEITAFSDRYNHWLSSLAGLTAGESYKGLLSSASAVTAFSERYRNSHSALAGLTAGVSSKGLLGSISAVTAFSDRYNHSFSTLAGLTTNDSLKYIFDHLSSTVAVLKPYAELHHSTAHYMNPIREQQRMIADVVNPILEQQRKIADIVNPILEQQRMTADIVNPMREQQRMIADIVNPMREQLRTIDMLTKPMLSDVTKNSMLSISDIAKDLTPSVNDSMMKQFQEEQQRTIDLVTKPYREQQRRLFNNAMKNLSL